MNVYSVFLPIMFFCTAIFAQFFADTTLVIEKDAVLPQDEHIKQTVENSDFKTRGLIESLGFESGIQKSRSGAVGNFEKFSIRGISGDRIGVFVNGNSVANAGGGMVDLSRYNGLNVSKIDIYRNFVPAELGGNLFGGAINIITENYSGGDDFSAQIFQLFGSFGELHSFANLNFIPLGTKTKVSLSADYRKADNDFKYMDYNSTFYGEDHEKDDTIRAMDNNEFKAFTFSGNIKNTQKKFDINGDFSMFNSKYHIPSPAGTRFRYRNRTAFDENSEYFFSVNQKFHNKENKINFAYLLAFDEFNWTYEDRIAFPYSLLPNNGKGKISTKNDALDGKYFHKFDFGSYLSLSSNSSARYERIIYSNDITGFTINDREVDRLNGSFSGDLKVVPLYPFPEVILGGTIRAYMDKINDWERGFVYEKIPDDTLFGLDKSLRFNINNYFLNTPFKVFADFVFAQKQPNLRQKYGYYGIIPNTNLLPEKVISWQTGAIAEFEEINLKINAAIFQNQCEDLIRIIYYRAVAQAKNIAQTSTFGFENNIYWKIFDKIELQNNLTFQEPKNLSDKSIKDLYIPEESKLKLNSSLQIGDFAGFSFISQYQYKSAYFHDLYNIHRVPLDENKRGLSFFSFILQYHIKNSTDITAQVGIYDILAGGNSPEYLTALENQYYFLRYPGISIKGSVLWEIGNKKGLFN
ncbi:MAG: TonB-dependent receptor plug domain-containing protein [Chitinivibrionia bacterium]|nr:TonB-dependent receptor plug domain-containing protein [Chitinivibrionia bacterium]